MAKKTKKEAKKRGNGTGTVYQLANGRWRWQVTLGYSVDGQKRHSLSGVVDSKTQAELAKAQALTDNARGLVGSSETISVAGYASVWLKRQQNLRPSSIRNYRSELAYALSHIGELKLKEVKPHHIKDTLLALSGQMMAGGSARGKPMSSRTLAKIRTRLRALFREAVIDQYIYVNPCEGVRPIRQPSPEPVGIALDFAQMSRLHELGLALWDAGVCRLFPAIFTAASLGLRRGEVMALRWEDIDLKKDVLKVRQNVTRGESGMEMGQPKTRHSRRDIPIPLSLKALLLKHLERQKAEQALAMDAWQDSGAVFATLQGRFTHPDNLKRSLQHILKWSDPALFSKKSLRAISIASRAKLEAIIMSGERLPDIKPHDLRHTAATLMLRRKVPVEVVSKILGHARVSITLDVYRHVLDNEARAVMVDLFETPLPERVAASMSLN